MPDLKGDPDPDEHKEKGATGGAPGMPSEEEMLRLLSAKFNIVPKDAAPPKSDQILPDPFGGARPKNPPLNQSIPAFEPDASSTPAPAPAYYQRPPKIPSFSGDEPVPKNEVGYYEWRHEVRCMQRERNWSQSQILQSIRNSLRGTARRLVVSLGDQSTVEGIFSKLDVNYSEPSRKGITMREFFNAGQKAEETVTAFGCRLESILEHAMEGGYLSRTARSELMCERLWSGLRSETLQSNTRHTLDSAPDYDTLLKHIRQVERELKLNQPPKSKTAHQNAQAGPDIQRQMTELEDRLNKKIDGVQSGIDRKFGEILKRFDTLSFNPQVPPPVPSYTPPPHQQYGPPPSAPAQTQYRQGQRRSGRGTNANSNYRNGPKV